MHGEPLGLDITALDRVEWLARSHSLFARVGLWFRHVAVVLPRYGSGGSKIKMKFLKTCWNILSRAKYWLLVIKDTPLIHFLS